MNKKYYSHGKRLLTYAEHPNSTIAYVPKGIQIISTHAFYRQKNLEILIFPYGVKTIEHFAVCECFNLKKIYIPNTVKIIEENAFILLNKNVEIYCQGEVQEKWIDKKAMEHIKEEVTTPEDDAFNFHRSSGSFTSHVIEYDKEVYHCWNPSHYPVFTHIKLQDFKNNL